MNEIFMTIASVTLSYFVTCTKLSSRPFLKEKVSDVEFHQQVHGIIKSALQTLDTRSIEEVQPRKKPKREKTKLEAAEERLKQVMMNAKYTLEHRSP
jgi:hypothetical protein